MLALPKADDGDAQRPFISASSLLRVSAAEPETQVIRKGQSGRPPSSNSAGESR
jgi:hypothetical protein